MGGSFHKFSELLLQRAGIAIAWYPQAKDTDGRASMQDSQRQCWRMTIMTRHKETRLTLLFFSV